MIYIDYNRCLIVEVAFRMNVPPDLQEEVMNDPTALEVVDFSIRHMEDEEELSEEAINQWREKSLGVIEKFPKLQQYL